MITIIICNSIKEMTHRVLHSVNDVVELNSLQDTHTKTNLKVEKDLI